MGGVGAAARPGWNDAETFKRLRLTRVAPRTFVSGPRPDGTLYRNNDPVPPLAFGKVTFVETLKNFERALLAVADADHRESLADPATD